MRKLEVLNTNYEKSGLYAKIPALNDMTLKEFFEGLNIVKNYDSVRTFNNAIETVDKSILIDSSVSLISGHEYFSAFDLIFKTMPADAPDSYRLWVASEGVTDTITHSFLTNEKEVFMNVKTSASSRTSDLYLNLFGMTIGQSMSLETNLYFIIDLSNLSFEVTEEQVYYYYRMYRYLKDSKSFDGFTYLPKGQSKYDVAYVNKTIDEVVYEGLTLRDIFETNNFVNPDLRTWNSTEFPVSYVNGYYVWNRVSTGIFKPLFIKNWDANTNFYAYIEGYATSINEFLRLPYSTIQIYLTNILSIQSAISVSTTAYNQITFRNDIDDNVEIKVKNIGFYNIDDIFTVPPTIEQMDYWRDLYLARKDIAKNVLTYADVFELYNLYSFKTLTKSGVINEIENGFNIDANDQTKFAAIDLSQVVGDSVYITGVIKKYSGTGAKVLTSNWRASTFIINHVEYINFDSLSIDEEKGFSAIRIISTIGGESLLIGRGFNQTYKLDFKNIFSINFNKFDESITKEQLDNMLAHYLLVKNIVIYPEIYVPVEPVGLGNRFKLLAVDDTVYGHELDFEDISFKMYFGVNFDAYKGYHAMMNMLRSNKAIIEYDWGIGPRYNDVRLLNAPKTEKDTSLLIISKFYFKRLNPFYELIEVSDEEDMKNESDLDSPVKLDLTVSNTTVSIKLLDASSGVQQEISFDFTGVSTPFNLTIDPETKKLLIDDITDAYDYADHTKDSFIYLPGDSEIYSINITGAAVNKITYKKWVIS
jgi:hypothetical protein